MKDRQKEKATTFVSREWWAEASTGFRADRHLNNSRLNSLMHCTGCMRNLCRATRRIQIQMAMYKCNGAQLSFPIAWTSWSCSKIFLSFGGRSLISFHLPKASPSCPDRFPWKGRRHQLLEWFPLWIHWHLPVTICSCMASLTLVVSLRSNTCFK